MRAFYFGPAQRQLFGAYHPADGHGGARPAVVLAYPWLAEYNMSHWAFRKLAGTLAQSGHPTLRFDFSGSGDSSGDAASARTEHWVSDILAATQEVRELSGLRRVSIVGLGLGATLALEAAGQQAFEDIVLWDPVLTGHEYLAGLDELDARQRLTRLYPRHVNPLASGQLLGYPFPAEARADLARIDIQRYAPSSLGRVLLMAGHWGAGLRALQSKLDKVCANVSSHVLKRTGELAEAAGGQTAMIVAEPLQVINEFLCGRVRS